MNRDGVNRMLAGVLKPEAHYKWWHTPVVALGGRTPAQTWRRNRASVIALVRSYNDPTFS